MISILLAASLWATSGPTGPHGHPKPGLVHSVANVSDPLSHGAIGDGLLSLNEAIQLHNRTLSPFQLSLGELNQLSGFGSDIAWINIDASWTPTITIERDLDALLDFPHGCLIQGFNGDAVLDFTGPGITRGFLSDSNFCSWRNLVLLGGPYGVDLRQTDASFGGTVFDHVTFDGQTQFAFRGAGLTTGGYSRVLFDQCTFVGAPSAIEFDDTAADRTSILVAFDTQIDTPGPGIVASLGDGGQGIFQFERLRVQAGTSALAVLRPNSGNRPLTFLAAHVEATGNPCMDLQGSAQGATSLDGRMLRLSASGAGLALRVGPLAGLVDGILEDSALAGGAVVETAGATPLVVANLRVQNGAVRFGAQSVSGLEVRDSRFDGCQITTSGSSPVPLQGCCLVGGSVTGQPQATAQLTASYQGGLAGANVTMTGPLAAAQLGSMDAAPSVAQAGGSISATMDLPAGYLGLLAIGPTLEFPVLGPAPFHAYLDTAASVVVPVFFVQQQSLSLPIPNAPEFWGTDWTAQAIVLAANGTAGPAVQIPPGRRFVVQ